MDSSNYATVVSLAPDEATRERVRMMRSFDPALAGMPAGDPRLDVPDPWYGDHDVFADVLAILEAAADGLVTDLPLLLERTSTCQNDRACAITPIADFVPVARPLSGRRVV